MSHCVRPGAAAALLHLSQCRGRTNLGPECGRSKGKAEMQLPSSSPGGPSSRRQPTASTTFACTRWGTSEPFRNRLQGQARSILGSAFPQRARLERRKDAPTYLEITRNAASLPPSFPCMSKSMIGSIACS